jgi:hypothetical protein
MTGVVIMNIANLPARTYNIYALKTNLGRIQSSHPEIKNSSKIKIRKMYMAVLISIVPTMMLELILMMEVVIVLVVQTPLLAIMTLTLKQMTAVANTPVVQKPPLLLLLIFQDVLTPMLAIEILTQM